MNFSRLSLLSLTICVVFASCSKDEEIPAYQVNNSVTPVDFLTEKKYTSLNIEIAYVQGYDPSTSALNNLREMLNSRINKSAGIKITTHSLPATGKVSVDLDAIREIEKSQRQSKTDGKTLTAWIMFLDTEYSESTNTQKVLGITYGASSMAIFEKSVYAYVNPDMPARSSLEAVVLSHEFGHILGLVNNGIQMQNLHQDSGHGAHCSNTECLMYWKTENNVKLNDVLGESVLPTFDANCLADLKAAGGK